MKRRLIRLTAILLLLTGVGVIGYPYASQVIYASAAESGMQAFVDEMEAFATKDPLGMEELYQLLDAENKRIYREGQSGLVDPFSYANPAMDLARYGIRDQIIAYVTVPSMGISLPIYLGANEENMKLGAAHLTETSYPIGGNNTNTVIAAHRGYSKAAMFRDIEKVSIGDEVYIHGISGTLTYKVTALEIILPTEVDRVLIQPGKDMVTLFTCHPYRQNKQRYVVYCERAEQ